MMPASGKPAPSVTIFSGKYKGEDAVLLESDVLRLTVVPGRGAKIASLIHKRTGRECLFQLPGERFRRASYGEPYENGEAAGFDEMFPTISECYCDWGPWAGAKMPDHGEVWSLPWKCEQSESEVRTWVHSVRFPYVLTRTVSLDRPDTILLRYQAENLSAFDFPALWSAHPLLNTTPYMRLIVPPAARNILNTVAGPALGAYGERLSFPVARTAEGKEFDLSRINSPESRLYFKYFFLDELKEGYAILHDPKTRETVGFSWPVREVPYLGMWVNEGGWGDCYHVAPEPCTAPFDRWDVARQWGKLPVIPAFGWQHWEMRITVALSENPQRMEPDGTIR